MQLLYPLACLAGILRYAEAAGETHIYIDQVPIYSKLASCAQDRVSAIVRAQSSGCGDNTQLTSFACFCLDSSSQFASIISTAVENQCGGGTTSTALTARHAAVQTTVHRARARATVTSAPTPISSNAAAADVGSALEAFNSYCSKSTELSRFQQPATVQITEGPKTVFVTPTSSPTSSPSPNAEKKSTPVAAIAVPVIIVPLALGAALWFFLRHRRQQRNAGSKLPELQGTHDSSAGGQPVMIGDSKELYAQHGTELSGAERRFEMPQTQNPAVELDAGPGPTKLKNEKLGLR